MIDLTQLENEVLALREQLARLEQEHADLRLELNEFELLYNARVGPIEARLAEVQLHIDEYRLRIELVQWRGKSLSPIQLEAEVEHRLHDQRQRAEAIHANADIARSFVPPPPIDAVADLDLKQVYRELAKCTHPDLAADEADRAVRSQRMVDINALYAQHDLEGLRKILRQMETARQAPYETPEQRLSRLKNERISLDLAIRHTKVEIAEINRDPLMALKLDAALARSRGRDVLAEVARQMQVTLNEAENELQQLIVKFREVVEAAGLAE
jgi:DNA repair exonuclease SbcCD ATPase subunit